MKSRSTFPSPYVISSDVAMGGIGIQRNSQHQQPIQCVWTTGDDGKLTSQWNIR